MWQQSSIRPFSPDDADYFARRAIEEQAAAQRATSEAARIRHEELAALYRFRSAMVATCPPRWTEHVIATKRPAEAFGEAT